MYLQFPFSFCAGQPHDTTRVEEGDSGLDKTPNRGKFAIYVFPQVSDIISFAFIRG